MTVDAAAKIGLPVIPGAPSASGAGRRRVFVHDFMLYRRDGTTNPPKVYGVGVRLVIEATELNASANFNSLAALAASAEMNFASAQYNLQTIGLSGPKIVLTVPSAGAYDVEKHAQLMRAIDAIVAAASDPSTIVTPSVVSVDVKDNTFYLENLGRTVALRQIAAGRSCRSARGTLQGAPSTSTIAALEATYRDVAASANVTSCTNTAPNPVEQATAQQIITQAGYR